MQWLLLQVWPCIADAYGLVVAPPLAVSLTKMMAMPDKEAAWKVRVRSRVCLFAWFMRSQ